MKSVITTTILCLFTIALCSAQTIESYRDTNGKYGFKDNTGKIVIPAKYTLIDGPNISGIYRVNIGAKYDDAAGQYYGGKWGIVNANGLEIVKPQYDMMEPYTEGLAAVNKGAIYDENYGEYTGGKWGFIDLTGGIVIPLQYDQIDFYYPVFVNGKAQVRLGGREFYIDKTGKEIK